MTHPDPKHVEIGTGRAFPRRRSTDLPSAEGWPWSCTEDVDRPTEDVDAFTDRAEGVAAAAEAVETALLDAGFRVTPVADDSGSRRH